MQENLKAYKDTEVHSSEIVVISANGEGQICKELKLGFKFRGMCTLIPNLSFLLCLILLFNLFKAHIPQEK